MDIPTHIQGVLSIGSPINEDELTAAVDVWQLAQGCFGLSGEEFTKAAVDAATGAGVFTVTTVTRVPKDWKSMEISKGGSLECHAAITPNPVIAPPPTAIGQILVKVWFSDPTVVYNGAIQPGKLVQWLKNGATLGTFASDLIAGWAEICPLMEGALHRPSWVDKSQFRIDVNARLTSALVSNLKFKALLLEAVSEFKIKWRFLSLYRLIEHGYLSELFQTLATSFFSTPKESLDEALKAIGSEMNQFIALANSASLQTLFVSIYDEFEKKRSAGNHFAVALDRSMQMTGQLKQFAEPWKRGVLIYYKIRCAIVHAGLSAPIYDAYSDSALLIEALMPICELIALTFLGVSII